MVQFKQIFSAKSFLHKLASTERKVGEEWLHEHEYYAERTYLLTS